MPQERLAVVGFHQYARLERTGYTYNCQRFYVVAWHPLLQGGVPQVRSWGRLGGEGKQLLKRSYADRQSTQLVAERLIRRRTTRCYEPADWT